VKDNRHTHHHQAAPVWVLVTLGFIALGALVATWAGWVGLGALTGFGKMHPLPGILDDFEINTAVTLPLGIEAYGFLAIGAWLSGWVPNERAAKFAMTSGLFSIFLGMSAQVAYHLLVTSRQEMPGGHAPWLVVLLVACVPNTVLGAASILAHLLRPGASGAAGEQDAPAVAKRSRKREKPAPTIPLLPHPAVVKALAKQEKQRAEILESLEPQDVQASSFKGVPPDVRQRALELIQDAEERGRQFGRSRLMQELDVTEHQAKLLLQEIRAQLQAAAAGGLQ
jgi:hypothetical protein